MWWVLTWETLAIHPSAYWESDAIRIVVDGIIFPWSMRFAILLTPKSIACNSATEFVSRAPHITGDAKNDEVGHALSF